MVGLLASYFLGRLLYFALSISPGLPPDEETHVGIIELYARSLWMLEDSAESYRLGLVTQVPYLYYLVMGKLLAVDFLGIDTTLYLRLWNVALSLLTLVVAYRLATLLTENRRVRILSLILATNTLMLTFLSASVSYDNLVNLLAVASFYCLVSFLRSGRARAGLGLLLALFLGSLTKHTFLPLAVILGITLLLARRRALLEDGRRILHSLVAREPVVVALSLLSVIALVANLWLYGGNLLRFGRVDPPCDAVLELEQCMENRIFARNWVVNQYRDDSFTYQEAVRETSRIRHAGDRDHAVRLLNNERAYKLSRPEALNVFDYIQAVWRQAMLPTIFGIQAHRSMLRTPNDLLAYKLIFLAAFILWVRSVSWRESERLWIVLAAAVIAYFVFLVGYVNYRGYLASHAPFLGVQGRYLFPVVWAAYLVIARSLLNSFRRWIQIGLLIVVGTVFVAGDLPYFRRHADPSWFSAPAAARSELPAGN